MVENRLGISTGAFWPQNGTLAAPGLVARLGVRDVEVMLQSEEECRPAFAHDLRRSFDAVDAQVRSVHIKQALHPILSGTPDEIAAGWDLFDWAIEGSALLGATVLVWHGPNRRREPGLPGLLERFPEATVRLSERCAAARITLTIENVSYCALPTVRDVRRFADGLDDRGEDRIGFTFDPFQAAEAEANPFLMLAAMGRRLANVHLSDYRSGQGLRHLPPGAGETPWPALLRAIGAIYDGPLMLESPLGPEPVETFRRIAAFLQPLIDASRSDVLATGRLPPGVREGIALFNAGAYYAAHEVIETEWHAERGPVRELYQGILQIGIGVHHARNGNRAGAILKLTDGIRRVEGFRPAVAGIDTAALVHDAAQYLSTISTVTGHKAVESMPVPPLIRSATPTA